MEVSLHHRYTAYRQVSIHVSTLGAQEKNRLTDAAVAAETIPVATLTKEAFQSAYHSPSRCGMNSRINDGYNTSNQSENLGGRIE